MLTRTTPVELPTRSPEPLTSFRTTYFFEWVFFRLLIDRGDEWPDALIAAGEPPLLARIVSLHSQYVFEGGGTGSAGLDPLAARPLRPQWRRAWLLGPSASSHFQRQQAIFENVLFADDGALLKKFLVWFQAERTIPNPLILQTRLRISRAPSSSVPPTNGAARPIRRPGHGFLHLSYALRRFDNEAHRIFGVMNLGLFNKRYLAAGQYTIADIICYPWASSWATRKIEIDEFPNVKRWLEEIGERPAVKKAMAMGPEFREDPASIGAEEQARRRKLVADQRAQSIPQE